MTSEPPRRQDSDRNAGQAFWKLMYQVALVSAATHLMFLGLFYGLGATTLACVNLGSVLLFAASYSCLRQRKNLLASMLIVFEIIAHAALAVRSIGWDSGFHYYLLVLVPVVVISQMKSATQKSVLIVAVVMLYLVMDHTMRDAIPYDILSQQALSALRYFNVTVTFALLTYLSGLYLTLVKQAERRLRILATTDPLTRLLNRRSMLELADYLLVQRKRHQDPLAVVLADIDHFKTINDQHGHAAGDAVLMAVSEVLLQGVREQDSVCRWGGEEFLILMPKATLEAAHMVAERLREKIAAIEIHRDGKVLQVRTTFGVSSHRTNENFDTSLSRADAALYKGKAEGRNQVVAEAP